MSLSDTQPVPDGPTSGGSNAPRLVLAAVAVALVIALAVVFLTSRDADGDGADDPASTSTVGPSDTGSTPGAESSEDAPVAGEDGAAPGDSSQEDPFADLGPDGGDPGAGFSATVPPTYATFNPPKPIDPGVIQPEPTLTAVKPPTALPPTFKPPTFKPPIIKPDFP